MASANLYDFNGELKGTVDLPEALFGGPVNKSVLYDAVRMYEANRRTGSANAKERGEIRFSNAKPYRQKGTGRARLLHQPLRLRQVALNIADQEVVLGQGDAEGMGHENL